MYVVRRAFRNLNKMMAPGSVVEPGTIKWFKTRLKDRKIVEVTEHNFNQWHEYFAVKHGVNIHLPQAPATFQEPVETHKPVERQEPANAAAKPAMKPVAKAVAKAHV